MKLPRLLNSVRSAFDKEDVPISIFVLGLILIAYGASQIHHGAGPILVGFLLVIYVKPLSRWVK